VGTVVTLLVVLVCIGVPVLFISWSRRVVRGRRIVTSLSEQQLQEIFTRTVACDGWHVVDDSVSMAARSSLPGLLGGQQEIALDCRQIDGRPVAEIVPVVVSYSRSRYVPSHPLTLAFRILHFVREVKKVDPSTSSTVRPAAG
jgi:hypothetical protein